MRSAKISASLALGTLAAGLTMGANAQTAPPDAVAQREADNGTVLQEVVVTAERRSSTVQKTPISITAISGEELDSRGISTVEDVVHAVPGVSIRSAGPGQTEFEMRGLSSSGGAAPTVGFYLDDAPLTPPAAALNGKVVVDPDLYDLDRVEVLRGPQGTLYGSGSMGGTIRLITKQPVLTGFSGSVEADVSGTPGGNVPNGTANLSLNLPIVADVAALRVVLTEKYASGWIDRIVENPFPLETNIGCAPTSFYGCARGNVLNGTVTAKYPDVNWEHLQGGRVELLVQPSDSLKILTTVFGQETLQGGYNTFDSPPGSSSNEAHYQPADVREPFQDRFLLVGNTVSYDLGFAELNAATSYWTRTQKQIQDASEGYQNLFELPAFLNSPTQSFAETDSTHQVSEEIRVSSQGDGPFRWIGGLFYSDLTSAIQVFAQTPELCFLSAGGCAANPAGLVYSSDNPYHIRQFAEFGEASYRVTPALTLTAGLRHFEFRNATNFTQAGIFSPSGNTQSTVAYVSATDTGVTPKFNLAYEPSSMLTLYGTASQGFRPGGVNLPVAVSGTDSCLPYLQAIGLNQAPLSFNPDKVWSYELGEKARLLGGDLTVNGDVYYLSWHGVQQTITLGCGSPLDLNAGNAASYGPELEIAYRLTPELTLEGSGTYTHATLTSVAPNTGLSVGQRLLNIPRYTENTSLIYRHSISNDATLTARLTNSLVGPTTDVAYYYVELPAYDILNARFELLRGAVAYALYVDNLTNTRAEVTANNTNLTFISPSLTRYSTNQPLTVGLSLRYRF